MLKTLMPILILLSLLPTAYGSGSKGDIVALAKKYDPDNLVAVLDQQLQAIKGIRLVDVIQLKNQCESSKWGDTIPTTTYRIATLSKNRVHAYEQELEQKYRPLNEITHHVRETYVYYEFVSKIEICLQRSQPLAVQALTLVHEASHAQNIMSQPANRLDERYHRNFLVRKRSYFLGGERMAYTAHLNWLQNYLKDHELSTQPEGIRLMSRFIGQKEEDTWRKASNALRSSGLGHDFKDHFSHEKENLRKSFKEILAHIDLVEAQLGPRVKEAAHRDRQHIQTLLSQISRL